MSLDQKIAYSVYLIKETYQADGYLGKVGDCDKHVFNVSTCGDVEVYLKRTHPATHSWNQLLPSHVSGIDWKKYGTTSLFGLMIIRVKGRVFALTAGHGRHLLDPFSYESNFGFKTVLNAVDHGTIKQLEKKTIKDNPKHSIEQVSKNSNLREFDIDQFTDLVSRVRGQSKIDEFGLMLDGRESLKLALKYELKDIPAVLEKCLDYYSSDQYKKHFPEIDNLSEVNDRSLKEVLNSELEKMLQLEVQNLRDGNETSGNIWSSIPELVTDDGFENFTFSKAKKALLYDDLDYHDCLRTYLSNDRSEVKSEISVSSLKVKTVYIKLSDGKIYPRWSIWECLNAVIEKADESYILVDGSWYRVSTDYLEGVDQKINAIPRSNYDFEVWPQPKREDAYLRGRPLKIDSDYFILDSDLVRLDGETPVEACDIYTENKNFIHLKRYGSSSVLGHLFNQGFVSADLLLNNKEFVRKLNVKLPTGSQLPEDAISTSDYTIGYVIGSKRPNNCKLPLFSKITLSRVIDSLTAKGYRVTLDYIQMQ